MIRGDKREYIRNCYDGKYEGKRNVMKNVKLEKPENAYVSKKTRFVYLFLRAIVIAILVIHAVEHDYESVFVCALSLLLMLLPSMIERRLWIRLSDTMEIIILLFIFAAEILGEINSFYMKVPHWDTVLHTMNGFLCAAVGFALVDLINRSHKFTFALSPVFLAIVAFCFSMTVGVVWEFFEYSCDHFLGQDMQKDTIVYQINSVNLNDTPSTKVQTVNDISDVIIVHSDGSEESLGLGGYLDVGLNDTMKDLLVNELGALCFSFIGYCYVKKRGKGELAAQFIPQVLVTEDEREKFEEELAENVAKNAELKNIKRKK